MANEINYGELIASVYSYCADPTDQQLPLQTVLRVIRDEDAAMCLDLDLSSQIWRMRTGILTVDGSTDTYRLTQTDFGRPIIVEIEPTGIGRARQRIRIVDLPDQEAYTSPSESWNGDYGGGLGYGVEEIGFYRSDGDVWARVSPHPTRAYSLQIHYEPVTFGIKQDLQTPDAVQATGIAAQILVARSAMRCLPYCRNLEPARMGPIRDTLVMTIADYRRQWDDYRFQDSGETPDFIKGFSLGNRRGPGW